ncbi:MAG: O-antigen ligase family protein [Deferribacteraceae bacterium]|jgi:O-antigen ligase|nr:O-antigen ligase family protein [Deferribacteraceae bacterium]
MALDMLLRLVALFSPISISITQILYGVIVVFLIYSLVKGSYREIAKSPYLKYFALMAAVLLVTTLLGDDPARSFKKYKEVLLPLTFLIGYYMCRRSLLYGVIFWTIAGGAIASIWGEIRYLLHESLGGPDDRSAGFFASPVSFGNIMALVVILGVSVLILRQYRSTRERNIYIIMTAISFMGLGTSSTRGAMIACMAGIIVGLLLVFRLYGIVMSIMLTGFAIALVMAIPELKVRFSDAILRWNDPTTSLGWRFVLWKESWQVFLSEPLTGVGFANLNQHFIAALPVKHQSVAHAHNNILQILAEHGIIGFIAVTALHLRLFIDQLVGTIRKNGFALMGLLLTVVFFVEGITEYSMFDSEICMLYWFIAGGLLAAQHSNMREYVQSKG